MTTIPVRPARLQYRDDRGSHARAKAAVRFLLAHTSARRPAGALRRRGRRPNAAPGIPDGVRSARGAR